MQASELIPILKRSTVFATVSEESLARLVEAGAVSSPETGTEIIRQGELSQRVWILLEGDLEILVDGESVNHVTSPGEPVGQISAVSVIPATATVRVAAPSRCLAVAATDLHPLFSVCPDLAEALLRSMVKYLGAR